MGLGLKAEEEPKAEAKVGNIACYLSPLGDGVLA